MGFDSLQTARSRLLEIETARKKDADEWGGGSSRIKYVPRSDLDREYNYIMSLITSDTDLDKTIVELKLKSNYSNRKVYSVQ